METVITSLDELDAFVARWAHSLPEVGPVVAALSGDLGSGKTTFVQHLARHLGIEEIIQSPTFVLEKIYDVPSERFHHMVHIDAYRLEGADDRILDLQSLVRDPHILVLIEWPEYLANPPHFTHTIRFQWVNDTARKLVDSHA